MQAKALPLAPGDPTLGRFAIDKDDDHDLPDRQIQIAPPAKTRFRYIADKDVDLAMAGMVHACLQQPALPVMKPLGAEIGVGNGHSVP